MQESISSALPSFHQDNLKNEVEKMRAVAPFGDVEWYSDIWDVTSAPRKTPRRSHDKKRWRLYFGTYCSSTGKRDPFPEPFANFAKVILCLRHERGGQTPEAHRVSLRALRFLFESLHATGVTDPTKLRVAHFMEAENLAVRREMESSAYRIGQRLEEVARLGSRLGIAPLAGDYKSSLRKPNEAPAADKMLSPQMLDAVADLSAKIAAAPDAPLADKIRMSAIDILVGTGFRVGEDLSLPLQPLVQDHEGFGLRYWPEKGGETKIRRIPSAAVELIERAVSTLSEACARPREMARWLHDNPGCIYFPPGTPAELTIDQVADLIGLTRSGAEQFLARHKVHKDERRGRRGAPYVRVSKNDLERALLSLRSDRPVIERHGSRGQLLHESLFVLFRNQLHPKKSTIHVLVEHANTRHINDFLGARGKSAFERYEIGDGNGRLIRITSHQFRHWLNTIAKRGGLNELELARFMGRRRIEDNRHYDHRTTEERAEEVRQLIREGKLVGAISDAYQACAPESRDDFLSTHVTAALLTPLGGCLHDWAQNPCALHLNCLSGCSEYYRTKGDAREVAALRELRVGVKRVLEQTRSESDEGTIGADNYRAHHERILANIDAALAIEDSDNLDGVLVPVEAKSDG